MIAISRGGRRRLPYSRRCAPARAARSGLSRTSVGSTSGSRAPAALCWSSGMPRRSTRTLYGIVYCVMLACSGAPHLLPPPFHLSTFPSPLHIIYEFRTLWGSHCQSGPRPKRRSVLLRGGGLNFWSHTVGSLSLLLHDGVYLRLFRGL
jgi:hypothetical protein